LSAPNSHTQSPYRYVWICVTSWVSFWNANVSV
jgi:hypothetical protein